MGDNWKQPKRKFEPNPQQLPKTAVKQGTGDLTVHWSFAIFDSGKLWWDETHEHDPFVDIAQHMRSFEGKNWSDIERQRKHDHPVQLSRLVREAQNRLEELKLDDIESLWRFRFTGERRIWGIRDGRLFKVLWWDPEHKVCPSTLKHT